MSNLSMYAPSGVDYVYLPDGSPAYVSGGLVTVPVQHVAAMLDAGCVIATNVGGMTYQGAIDCSTTPNYPAAVPGDTYVVSVAGKIGGSSGTAVDVGDMLINLVASAAGTQAAVGVDWNILEANQVAAASVANLDLAVFSGTGGRLLATSGKKIADLMLKTAAAPTDANLAVFSGTTGTLVTDSGKAIADLMLKIASAPTSGNFPVFSGTTGTLMVDSGKAIADFSPALKTIGGSTAASGSTAGDAATLPAATGLFYPTTAADGTKGVKIHANDKVTGRLLIIGNTAAAVLKVYPPTGGNINGLGTDTAYSSASQKSVMILCISSTGNTWAALG